VLQGNAFGDLAEVPRGNAAVFAEAAGLLETDAPDPAGAIVLPAFAAEVAAAAGDVDIDHAVVPDLPAIDLGADLGHFAGRFMSRDQGQFDRFH
jgi:hypothetical protein